MKYMNLDFTRKVLDLKSFCITINIKGLGMDNPILHLSAMLYPFPWRNMPRF